MTRCAACCGATRQKVTRLRVQKVALSADHSHGEWGVRFLCLQQDERHLSLGDD